MPEHRDDHWREDRDQDEGYDDATASQGDLVTLEAQPGDLTK
jgi:hypothetical protein